MAIALPTAGSAPATLTSGPEHGSPAPLESVLPVTSGCKRSYQDEEEMAEQETKRVRSAAASPEPTPAAAQNSSDYDPNSWEQWYEIPIAMGSMGSWESGEENLGSNFGASDGFPSDIATTQDPFSKSDPLESIDFLYADFESELECGADSDSSSSDESGASSLEGEILLNVEDAKAFAQDMHVESILAEDDCSGWDWTTTGLDEVVASSPPSSQGWSTSESESTYSEDTEPEDSPAAVQDSQSLPQRPKLGPSPLRKCAYPGSDEYEDEDREQVLWILKGLWEDLEGTKAQRSKPYSLANHLLKTRAYIMREHDIPNADGFRGYYHDEDPTPPRRGMKPQKIDDKEPFSTLASRRKRYRYTLKDCPYGLYTSNTVSTGELQVFEASYPARFVEARMVDDKTIQHDVEVDVSWGDGQACATRMKINADVGAMDAWTRHKDALKLLKYMAGDPKAHVRQYAKLITTSRVMGQDAPTSVV